MSVLCCSAVIYSVTMHNLYFDNFYKLFFHEICVFVFRELGFWGQILPVMTCDVKCFCLTKLGIYRDSIYRGSIYYFESQTIPHYETLFHIIKH